MSNSLDCLITEAIIKPEQHIIHMETWPLALWVFVVFCFLSHTPLMWVMGNAHTLSHTHSQEAGVLKGLTDGVPDVKLAPWYRIFGFDWLLSRAWTPAICLLSRHRPGPNTFVSTDRDSELDLRQTRLYWLTCIWSRNRIKHVCTDWPVFGAGTASNTFVTTDPDSGPDPHKTRLYRLTLVRGRIRVKHVWTN